MKILNTIVEVDIDARPSDLAYILKDNKYLCFLDSSLVPNKYSRFSYIGWEPEFVLKSHGYKNEYINIVKNIRSFSYQHPLNFLKQNIYDFTYSSTDKAAENIKKVYISSGKVHKATPKTENGLPDFKGGYIGYFAYDLKNYIEELPQTVTDDIKLPIMYLCYYRWLLSYSHESDKWYFIKNFLIKQKDAQNKGIYETTFSEDDFIDPGIKDDDLISKVDRDFNSAMPEPVLRMDDIKKNLVKKYYQKKIPTIKLHSNFTRPDYLKKVLKTKEYIHNGDIYQANFSQRFESDIPVESMDLYYILREKNAAPFSAYLSFPEMAVGSSSPERFLFMKDGIIETRPIKGTRPRGRDEVEDLKNIEELKNSIKDQAELNMIVDLERNDLGKFCYYGSIKVEEHRAIEKYAKVFHSVSTVTGKIKKGIDVSDIIKATFPGGSITGAPKIRAMEIIDELEPSVRNVYTGAIGYIGIDNIMDLNIVIRTFVIKDNKLYYNVGGGIVSDSVPEEEFEETLDKGRALEETLKFFEAKNLKTLL